MPKQIKNTLLLTIILLCLALLGADSRASERLYQIELLVFTQNAPSTEHFEQTTSQIAWPQQVTGWMSYPQLANNNRKLLNSAVSLAKRSDYQLLASPAWIQSVPANSLSTAVQISNHEGTINGFFRLQRGSLIQMIVDLELTPADNWPATIYRLREKRRFKLNEIHYLDHPKLGVIAYISPLTTADAFIGPLQPPPLIPMNTESPTQPTPQVGVKHEPQPDVATD